MANILITGVTSFLGREIAQKILDRNHDVYGLIRSNSKNNRNLDARLIKIICGTGNIEKLLTLKNFKVDVLIHLAWDGIGKEGRMNQEIQRENIENTLKTIEIAHKLGCQRVLFAGSQAEYGMILEEYIDQLLHNNFRTTFEDSYLRSLNLHADASVLSSLSADADTIVEENEMKSQLDQLIHATRVKEDTPCNPKSMYGKAKLEVWERASGLCRNLGMDYIHLRIFSVYGPYDHETSLIKTIVRAKKHGESVTLSECNQLWNYMYIEDCAKTIVKLMYCNSDIYDHQFIVNIAGKDTRIMRSFISEIGAGDLLRFEKREPSIEGTPFLSPSIERLESLIQFKESFTFQEGIREIERLYPM